MDTGAPGFLIQQGQTLKHWQISPLRGAKRFTLEMLARRSEGFTEILILVPLHLYRLCPFGVQVT